MKKEKWYVLAVIATVFSVGSYFILSNSLNYNKKKKRNIKQSEYITIGYVREYTKCVKCTGGYKYTYNFKDTLYNGDASTSALVDEYTHLGEVCVGKTFPLLVDSLHPEISKLLITPADFEFYNMVFPDSLSWILQYVK